jgi:GAF domain-containing protein/HAMP domain-containing protein
LAARFQFAVVAAAVLPLVLVSILVLLNNLLVQRTQIADLQREATKNAVNVIDAYLQQIEDEMALAVRGRFFRDGETSNALLDTLLSYNAGFETLSIMDESGQEVVKRSRYLLFSAEDLTNQAASAEFLAASAGERYLGPITISQYAEPLVTLAIPIKNVRGDVTGVLAAEINLKYMWDIIARLEPGLGSYAYVVDSDGRLIAHRDSSLVLQGKNLSELTSVQNALRGQPISGSYTGLEGEPVLGLYQRLSQADWFVVLEAPTHQALASVYRTLLFTGGAVLVALFLAVLLGWWLARIVIRPVRTLQEGAEIIGLGDLSHRIEIRSGDEIGALASAFNDMAGELQQTIGTLEQRVADRTRDLERRAVQLETAAEVGRAAASILDLDSLLFRVVDLVRERFGLYYTGLFLVDDSGDFAMLEAGTGEAGRVMLGAGHRLAVGGRSMVGQACSERSARIALDVDAEAATLTRFDNPLLPDTRSEMALPLAVGDRVLGAMDVQSTEAAAFSQADIDVLQLVADQVAVAVDNARKFSEEAGLLEATSPLYRISHRLAVATTVEEVSQAILSTVSETEADGCLVAQFDRTPAGEVAGTDFLGRWEREGRPRGLPAQASIAAGELLPLLSRPSVVEDVTQDEQIPAASRTHLAQLGIRSLVTVPLRVASSGRVQGFLAIDRQTPGPFSPVSLRLYETLAEQAAVALERARLLEASQQQAWREHHIRDISDRITSSFDLDQLVRTTVEELGMMIGAAGGYVEIAPPTGKVEVEAGNGSGGPSGSGSNGREEEAGT